MFTKERLEELAKKLFSVLPENIQNIDTELQSKFNDVINVAFSKLDLVTREEFDVQVKVLARTREKIESLEAALDSLIQITKK